MSFVFAPERKFKEGKNGGDKWIAPPPGSYFSSTANRQTSSIYTTGSKKWETTAYGAFSGTWDWTFMLDYYYLEPLLLAFDTVNDMKWVDSAGYSNFSGDTFVFKKERTGRVPSFTVRRKILHRVAGGETDEMVELMGCVVSSISFSRSASTSQYQVQMSGTYATEMMTLGDLGETDYQPYNGELVEYSCVAVADSADSKIDGATYVANTDSISVSIQSNTNMVFNTCTPFAAQYYEDRGQFQISTSCYSTDPEVYKTRMYSGGHDSSKRAPMSKGLKPMEKMFIISFNGEVDENKVSDAYNNSGCSICFEATKLVVKSMKWVNGDGGKLTDSLSSTDCRDISLTIKRDTAGNRESLILHELESVAPESLDDGTYVFEISENKSTFSLNRGTRANILGTVKAKVNQDVTQDDVEKNMTGLTYGYVYVEPSKRSKDSAVSLNSLIVTPNLSDTIPGVTVMTAPGTYVKLTGAPSEVGDYFIYVFNPTTKAKGVICIEVKP